GSAVSADGHPAHRVRLLGLPRSCRQSCSRRVFFFSCSGAHRDLHSFPTRRSSDLDEVREALGVAQLNLLGVSYGTRVAQQYAMRHPDSTRALVLDSVAPNTLILGNEFAANLEHALDLQFDPCEQSSQCVEAVGEPRAQLDALMARLRSEPPLVRYRDAATGESKEEPLTADAVAGLMRMYAYMPLMSSVLPLQLHEAAEGRYDGLMALSR